MGIKRKEKASSKSLVSLNLCGSILAMVKCYKNIRVVEMSMAAIQKIA